MDGCQVQCGDSVQDEVMNTEKYEKILAEISQPPPLGIEGCEVIFEKTRGCYYWDDYGGGYIGKHLTTYIFYRLADKTFFRIKRFWNPRSRRIPKDNFLGRIFGFYNTVYEGVDLLMDDYEPFNRESGIVIKSLCDIGMPAQDAIDVVNDRLKI